MFLHNCFEVYMSSTMLIVFFFKWLIMIILLTFWKPFDGLILEMLGGSGTPKDFDRFVVAKKL